MFVVQAVEGGPKVVSHPVVFFKVLIVLQLNSTHKNSRFVFTDSKKIIFWV